MAMFRAGWARARLKPGVNCWRGMATRMSDAGTLWGPLLAAPAGALACYGLARLAARRPMPDRHGWRQVRPGALHWTGLVLAGGLVALMVWIGLFVGSSRPDADFQMRVLWGLVAAFTVGGFACLARMRAIARAAICWRGRQLAFAGAGGGRVVRAMDEVVALRHSPWRGVGLVFADGLVLRVDPHVDCAANLLERVGAT